MTLLTYLLFAVATGAAFYFWNDRNALAAAWRVEREARERIHQARTADNNQRSVDNERWAERVQQGKRHAFEAGWKWGWQRTPLSQALRLEGFDQ